MIEDAKRDIAQVSKIAAELARARVARTMRRWRLASVILAALLIASNAAWLIVRALP